MKHKIQEFFDRSDDQLLKDSKIEGFPVINSDKIKVPKYLEEFVKLQLDNWIKAYVYSFYGYCKDVNYVVKDIGDNRSIIEIIDYKNTGVLQEGVNLSNGIHQFLQIKHSVELTNETLVSCFISNVKYFKMYGNRMVGLTGTIGSENEKQMLSKLYENIRIAVIPTAAEKRVITYPPIVQNNRESWISYIGK